MSKRAAVVFAGAVLLWLAAPLAALADEPCAPLEVGCRLDGLLDPTSDQGPIDDVIAPVDDVVDEVGDRVDPVVDDLLGGGGVIEPPGGGIVEPPGGGVIDPPDGGGGDQPPGPAGEPGNGRDGRRDLLDPAAVASTAVRESGGFGTDIIPAADGTRETPIGSSLPPGGIVEAAITGALLLLGLFVVAVGFVLLQDRLDRGDPKLSIAPVRADVVAFE